MATLTWCKQQKIGIKLIEPNPNLAEEYLNSAEETLTVLKEIRGKSKMWQATTKYYFTYFLTYAVLMKLGIKSEIHDCTIELAKVLEQHDILPQTHSKNLEKDKQLRIDNQYYLKNVDVEINIDELIELLLDIKKRIHTTTQDKIIKIRKLIDN